MFNHRHRPGQVILNDETADDRDVSTISTKSLHASSAEKDQSVSHRVPIDQRLCGPRTSPLDSRDSSGKTWPG